MSSILKALKKIEGRKVDTSLPAWPYGAGNPESMDRQVHRSRQRQKILGVLIILCVAALAGKLYIGSRPATEKTAPETKASQSTALPEMPAGITEPEPRTTVVTTTERSPSQEAAPETAPPAVDTPSPVEETAPETTIPKVVSPPAPEPSESVTREEPPAAPARETFSPPPAGNAGLTLMALVWSEQPDSRFVVINGTIVRQGGSIGNSTVVRIEGDYVVMKTGGVTWKLK